MFSILCLLVAFLFFCVCFFKSATATAAGAQKLCAVLSSLPECAAGIKCHTVVGRKVGSRKHSRAATKQRKKTLRPKSVVGRVNPAGEEQLATVDGGAGLAARHDCFNNQGLELLSLSLLLCSQAAPPGH